MTETPFKIGQALAREPARDDRGDEGVRFRNSKPVGATRATLARRQLTCEGPTGRPAQVGATVLELPIVMPGYPDTPDNGPSHNHWYRT